MSLKQSELDDLKEILDCDEDGEIFFTDAKDIARTIQNFEQQILERKASIELLRKAEEIAKKVDVERGEARYAKGLGDCLIQNVYVNLKAYTKSTVCVQLLDEEAEVEYKDILPVAKANKILYGDNK